MKATSRMTSEIAPAAPARVNLNHGTGKTNDTKKRADKTVSPVALTSIGGRSTISKQSPGASVVKKMIIRAIESSSRSDKIFSDLNDTDRSYGDLFSTALKKKVPRKIF